MITPTISPSETSTVSTAPATAAPAIVPFSFSRFQELIDAHGLGERGKKRNK
jgi:hypothetical protein